jgi:hypothetical protein
MAGFDERVVEAPCLGALAWVRSLEESFDFRIVDEGWLKGA